MEEDPGEHSVEASREGSRRPVKGIGQMLLKMREGEDDEEPRTGRLSLTQQ